ncbi:MAG: xylulokinase [Propionibacteriaceae bacterium]|jgi:xylulokinase|nr:xylulokinase [Propionibacteriaceae bacterium]
MALVAGVDSSTQSCTVELRDADSGALIGTGSAPHPPTTPPVSEQDPGKWWEALALAMARAKESAQASPGDIAAISVAAQCHGLVLQDAAGKVLRPVKLWNDLTSAEQAAAMVSETGKGFWADAVGSVPTAAFTITKLAWMAQHEPQVLAQAASVCVPHDWLTWKLSGELVTDRSDASGTCYYAAHESRYRHDILERFGRVGDSLKLPAVLAPTQAVGKVALQAAAELGISPNTLVAPGAGDQHAGSLGMGIGPTDVLFSLGTSGVVMTVSNTPVHDHSGWVNGVSDPTGRYLPLVCTLNSTKVTDWFRQLLGVGFQEFDELALSVSPSERLLTLAAFLDGERSPDLPLSVGILAGLSTSSTRAQLAQAAIDGVVLGLLEGLDAISASAPANGRVVVAGGGAKSAAYRQTIADFLQREVLVLEAPGATPRGAALQAAAVLGQSPIDQVRDAWRPPVASVTHPGALLPGSIRERYRELAGYRGMDR